jgi:hypothetical protein
VISGRGGAGGGGGVVVVVLVAGKDPTLPIDRTQ